MTAHDGSVLGTAKIVDHGPDARHWNVVILAEGYRRSEQAKFHDDADRFAAHFATVAPFDEIWNQVNIHRVDIASTDSGADDPEEGVTARTFLDATFSSDGYTRRLLEGDSGRAVEVAQASVELTHLAMVMVNHDLYGVREAGSRGSPRPPSPSRSVCTRWATRPSTWPTSTRTCSTSSTTANPARPTSPRSPTDRGRSGAG